MVNCYTPEEIKRLTVMDQRFRKAAKEYFPKRVAFYHTMIGGTYTKITIRDQKTRWGSCSQRRNLNFNWKLIMARSEALDYVVIHELCHMIHLNHSPEFWALVAKHMPDYKKWQDYLKKEFAAPL